MAACSSTQPPQRSSAAETLFLGDDEKRAFYSPVYGGNLLTTRPARSGLCARKSPRRADTAFARRLEWRDLFSSHPFSGPSDTAWTPPGRSASVVGSKSGTAEYLAHIRSCRRALCANRLSCWRIRFLFISRVERIVVQKVYDLIALLDARRAAVIALIIPVIARAALPIRD